MPPVRVTLGEVEADQELARNEYWSRIRMVHEFSLPDDLVMISRNAAISWACLSRIDSIRE